MIAIIGILSGSIVVALGGITSKANIAKSQVFSNSLRNALMSNLISEWKLDQVGVPGANQTPDNWAGNTGTLADGSTCSSIAPIHCPQLQTANCISGSCLSFDGTDDYISFASAINTAKTQSGWFYFSTLAKTKGTSILLFNNLYQHQANNFLYIKI